VPVTRRAFIGLGFVAAIGAASTVALELAARRAGGPSLAELPAALADPLALRARRIGRAWLAAHPEEADRDALARLLGDLPGRARAAESVLRDAGVRAWLRERQRDDFVEDRIVELDGWWLSQTEARFCAWLAIS